MEFSLDQKTTELRQRLLEFMDSHVYPAEKVSDEQHARLADPPLVLAELSAEACRQGL